MISQKFTLLVCLAVACMALAIAVILGCSNSILTQPSESPGEELNDVHTLDDPLPRLDEIERIFARCYEHPLGLGETPRMQVGPEHFQELLEILRDASPYPIENDAPQVLSELFLVRKNGTPTSILIYWPGMNVPYLYFSVDGKLYRANSRAKTETGRDADHAIFIDSQVRRFGKEVD